MKRKRILLADDEPVMQELMVAALKALACKIDVVENGLQAVDRIKQKPYDLIITDYEMPKMNGLELIRWVKSNRPATPVIIVTGTAPAQEILKSEATACIIKPFNLIHFQKTVKQALGISSELEGMAR